MIDPNTKEGQRVQVLLKEVVQKIKMDSAMTLAGKEQGKKRDPRKWAKVGYTAVGPLREVDWGKIWPALRERCEAEGIVYPFTEDDEKQMMSYMKERLEDDG